MKRIAMVLAGFALCTVAADQARGEATRHEQAAQPAQPAATQPAQRPATQPSSAASEQAAQHQATEASRARATGNTEPQRTERTEPQRTQGAEPQRTERTRPQRTQQAAPAATQSARVRAVQANDCALGSQCYEERKQLAREQIRLDAEAQRVREESLRRAQPGSSLCARDACAECNGLCMRPSPGASCACSSTP